TELESTQTLRINLIEALSCVGRDIEVIKSDKDIVIRLNHTQVTVGVSWVAKEQCCWRSVCAFCK
ncbi:unnamed protein product, partial [Brassica oleracea]